MPSTSDSQQRLFLAAEHGATFPKAKKLRESMSLAKLKEFSRYGPLGRGKKRDTDHDRDAGHDNDHDFD